MKKFDKIIDELPCSKGKIILYDIKIIHDDGRVSYDPANVKLLSHSGEHLWCISLDGVATEMEIIVEIYKKNGAYMARSFGGGVFSVDVNTGIARHVGEER